MTAEYEFTKDDLIAFNLYHHRHSPTSRRQYRRAWFVPAYLWLFLCIGIWYVDDLKRGEPLRTFLDLLPLFCGVPLYLLYFPWAYRRNLRKIVAGMVSEGQNRGLFGRRRVTISLEGVTETGEFGQTTRTWRGIERVTETEDYVYIYANAVAAFIVPSRAFAGPSEFEEFVRAARGYHEKFVVQQIDGWQ